MSRFAIGTLVRARGREWGVLPESQDDLVILRPLAGMAEEVTGIVGLLRRGGRVVPTPPAGMVPRAGASMRWSWGSRGSCRGWPSTRTTSPWGSTGSRTATEWTSPAGWRLAWEC